MAYSHVPLDPDNNPLKNEDGTTKVEIYQNMHGATLPAGRISIAGKENYPIYGKTTIGDGQTLAFHVDASKGDYDRYNACPLFKRCAGVLNVPSESHNPYLAFEGGWQISIQNADSKIAPLGTNFWIIRAPYTEAIEDAIAFNGSSPSITVDTDHPIEYSYVEDAGEETIEEAPKVFLYGISGGTDNLTLSENLKDLSLYWMSSEEYGISGLVLGDGYLVETPLLPDPRLSSLGANRPLAHGFSVAQLGYAARDTNSAMQNCLGERLCDVKGDSDDPFICVFGSHGRQKEIYDLGYKLNGCGLLLGLDYLKTLKSNAFLKYGAFLSFSHNGVKFFGSEAENERRARQNTIFGGIFGAYENFDARGLKTNFNATAGIGFTKNKVWRTDIANNRFDGKFNGTNFYLNCEFIKNVAKVREIQFGPWLSISYNRINQRKYSESGDAASAASVGKVNFDLFDTILGISLEREIRSPHDSEKHSKIFAKIGWESEPSNSHSSCDVTIGDGSPVSPSFTHRSRHSLFLSGGFRSRLNQRFEVSGGIFGRLSKNHHYISANVSVGYSF
jgi:hypothetical protein